MAVYRNITVDFWTDKKVLDSFTPEDKYFYLYLMTNDKTNICGCYEYSMKKMIFETGYSADTIDSLLKKMESYHHVIAWDKATSEILLKNWHKYNWSKSPKVEKAVRAVSEKIKSNWLREIVLSKADERFHSNRKQKTVTDTDIQKTVTDTVTVTDTAVDTVISVDYGYPIDTVSEETDLTPPTLNDVKAYCEEINSKVTPQVFFCFYKLKNWCTEDGQPIRDWKALLRKCEESGSMNRREVI